MDQKPQRLESLDVLRGFDMFFIFLPDPAPCVCFVLLAALGLGNTALAAQFDHARWIGFHFYDLIFPLFLFISGVTWPFSLASQRAKGVPTAKIALKILRRAVLLFLLGALVQTKIDGVQEYGLLAFEWDHFRVWSVIGRIGLAWGAAAFLFLACGRKTRLVVTVLILVVMGTVMRFATAPGAPAGTDPIVHSEWMLANWIDAHFLTTRHTAEGGFVTITMVATAMFGMFAGEILREKSLSPNGKLGRLFVFAGVLGVAGLFLAFGLGSWSLPIIKAVWTSSFALVAGALSVALLASFYWIVDIRGRRRWGFFFKIIGMNAITIYVLVRTILPYEFEKAYFFGGVAKFLSPAVAELVAQTGLIALGWLLLYYLYRKNIFLRV